MGLVFRRVAVETPLGPRGVLVVEPDGEILISRARFERMRAGELGSVADEAIVSAARELGPVVALLFRANDEREGDTWRFADDLSEEECVELASLFIRAHLAVFKKLTPLGVVAMIGVEFGDREAEAYHAGLERLADQLQSEIAVCRDEDEAAELRLGLWFAERQASWTTTPLNRFIDESLPGQIQKAARQLRRLRQLGDRVAPPDDMDL